MVIQTKIGFSFALTENVIRKNGKFEINGKDYKIVYTADDGRFYGIYDAIGIEKLLRTNNVIKGKDLKDAVNNNKITEYPKSKYEVEEQILSAEQKIIKKALLEHNNTDLINELIVLMNNITREDFTAIFTNDYNPDNKNNNACVFNFNENRSYSDDCLKELIAAVKRINTTIIRKTVKINGSDILLVFRERRSNEHPRIENKKLLEYSHVCFSQDYSVTYFLLRDIDAIVMRTDNENGTGFKYNMTIDNGANWDIIYMDEFANDDLIEVFKRIEIEIAKSFGRYILPLENVYILISGENFDGEESSRIFAGGFLVLEVVQGVKIFKFIKGVKILSKTGARVNVARRVMFAAAKSISKDAAIDMSAQFIVNFVADASSNPEADAWDITSKALYDINIGNAFWSGLINYTSLNSAEQTALDCAYRMFKSFKEGGDTVFSLIDGVGDCAILLGSRYLLKYLRNTDAAKQLAKAIADTKQYDIVMQKLSTVMTADQFESFLQVLLENGIQKGVEPLWAK